MANISNHIGNTLPPSTNDSSANNESKATSDNIAAAAASSSSPPPTTTTSTKSGGWGSLNGLLKLPTSLTPSSLTDSFSEANTMIAPLSNFTKSLSHNLTGRASLPDKTTASQVLMFRQLLHTKCRPGLRLSRGFEGTAAQLAVLHMPWWERGIEQSKKMVISYDNLITRLWLSGAIMPYEKGGYASSVSLLDDIRATTTSSTPLDPIDSNGEIDTLINDRGLPPVPHQFWVDRLGFQQDDPVTDFRSGGVLSLAMLVHIVESCPLVHARFVPKHTNNDNLTTAAPSNDPEMSLEQIITEDASVLPFGITCINVTDMLAKFLMFSKSVDKMDALLSAKPFWKMFIDPNAMLILQEVSLDLLCDVCVEIGRERRLARLNEDEKKKDDKSFGQTGKVTVFDFSEIMERTEKRVGDEVLGSGPQNVDELRAVARRVKSKYLLRIQSKEKHTTAKKSSPQIQLSSILPSKESTKNVTNAVIGGVGSLATMWKSNSTVSSEANSQSNASNPDLTGVEPCTPEKEEIEIQYIQSTSTTAAAEPPQPIADTTEDVLTEAFDLLGGDFSADDLGDHDQDLLDMMDVKVDPSAAFTIDDDDFRI